MSFKNVAVLLTVLGFSCGDVVESIGEQKTETSPGTFSGTVAGNELRVKSAVFATVQMGSKSFTYLALADVPELCHAIKANRFPANATLFFTGLQRIDDKNEYRPTDVGDYTVDGAVDAPGDRAGNTLFLRNDANCKNTLAPDQERARSGLFEITAFNPAPGGKMTGSFDVTFGDQKDKATGTFAAEYCDSWYYTVNRSQPSCE